MMGSITCNMCLTKWMTLSSLNSPVILAYMYFQVPGNKHVCCATSGGKWAVFGASDIPVNYTTSQSQHWAHKTPRPHPPPRHSEWKEFAGGLRELAERVAAGEVAVGGNSFVAALFVWWWRPRPGNPPVTWKAESPLITPTIITCVMGKQAMKSLCSSIIYIIICQCFRLPTLKLGLTSYFTL